MGEQLVDGNIASPLSLLNVFNADLIHLMERELAGAPRPAFVEIGFAPGKVLDALVGRFSGTGVGYDYSESGCAAARRYLWARKSKIEIVCRDVVQAAPDPFEADVCYSIGVVEHFKDPGDMVRAHLAPIRKGGKAIIIMPNYSGAAGRFQGRLDNQNLAIHNLELMKLEYWERFFTAMPHVKGRCYYSGRPSPWMFSLSRWGSFGRALQYVLNFCSLALPRKSMVLPSMIVVVMEKAE